MPLRSVLAVTALLVAASCSDGSDGLETDDRDTATGATAEETATAATTTGDDPSTTSATSGTTDSEPALPSAAPSTTIAPPPSTTPATTDGEGDERDADADDVEPSTTSTGPSTTAAEPAGPDEPTDETGVDESDDRTGNTGEDDEADADDDDEEPSADEIDVPAGPIVVSEIHFHPPIEAPGAEFVELTNRSSEPVDLDGWCVDGADLCIEETTPLEPGAALAFRAPLLQGNLSNGGEDLVVTDPSGDVSDRVDYDDSSPWPATADGEGPSIQRRNLDAPSDHTGNWVAAPPTPDAPTDATGGVLPVWSDVEHTVSPEPGAPIRIDARVDDAEAAELIVRIGFGPDDVRPVPIADDGTVSVEIPGQPADTLIRYRLRAQNAAGDTGTWPRQGDGATYTGTVVAAPNSNVPTNLPRFLWFMEDDVYTRAEADIGLGGDEGYPAVFAHDGQVFDNTTVRVKGESSVLHPKKKWKFILPAGHELDIDGVTPGSVDEFALHSSWVDRSFVRERLAAGIAAEAGIAAPQVYPVQVERNGIFYGLYHYVEQEDGDWRDRYDLDDRVLYEVNGQEGDRSFPLDNATLPPDELRAIYARETFEWSDDDELRDLITNVNIPDGLERRDWMLQNLDMASFVNGIAVNLIIQHADYGHKNFRLGLDEHRRWSFIPQDFDLVMGRVFNNGAPDCGTQCDVVRVQERAEIATGPLFAMFELDPTLRSMVARRVAELVPRVFDVDDVIETVLDIAGQVSTEAARDRFVWQSFAPEPPEQSAWRLIEQFVVPQWEALTGRFVTDGYVAAEPQPDRPALEIVDVVADTDDDAGRYSSVTIANRENTAIDLSGFALEPLEFAFAPGTVVPAGASIVVVHDRIDRIPGAYPCCLVGGLLDDEIVDADAAEVTLVSSDDSPVASVELAVDSN